MGIRKDGIEIEDENYEFGDVMNKSDHSYLILGMERNLSSATMALASPAVKGISSVILTQSVIFVTR